MDIVKLLPLIFRLMELLPKIKEALRGGASVFELLKTYGPDLIALVQSVGGQLFPNLGAEAKVEAGALTAFDQEQVRWIQNSLNKLGYTDTANKPLTVDGDYGQKTKEAVTKFQTKFKLVADGWAGKLTTTAMQGELNKLAPPTPKVA